LHAAHFRSFVAIVTAPDVTAPDRGGIVGTIAPGRRIQALSVRETHYPDTLRIGRTRRDRIEGVEALGAD